MENNCCFDSEKFIISFFIEFSVKILICLISHIIFLIFEIFLLKYSIFDFEIPKVRV